MALNTGTSYKEAILSQESKHERPYSVQLHAITASNDVHTKLLLALGSFERESFLHSLACLQQEGYTP